MFNVKLSGHSNEIDILSHRISHLILFMLEEEEKAETLQLSHW